MKVTKQIRVIYTDRDGSITIDKIGPRGDVQKNKSPCSSHLFLYKAIRFLYS